MTVSRTDLNPVFQEINQEYFDDELSGIRVEWNHLDQDSGQARKLGEREFVIMVDRSENTSVADVRETLEHEACHVYVDWREKDEHDESQKTWAEALLCLEAINEAFHNSKVSVVRM